MGRGNSRFVREGAVGLLREHAGFRVYWVARTLSVTGDQLARVVLVALVYQGGGGAAGVSVLLLAYTTPRLLGPLAGVLADRWSTRTVMIGADLAQAGIFLALTWTGSVRGTVVLVALAALAATAYQPAGRSNLPRLVPIDRLTQANALLTAGSTTGLALGPALAGVLLATAGARTALLVNAATFLLSAGLTTRLPPLRHGRTSENAAPLTMSEIARQARGAVRDNPIARAVAVLLLVTVAFAALDNSALIFLVRRSLHAPNAAYGWVVTAYSLGMIAAPLLISATGRRLPARRLLYTGQGVFAAGTFATGLAPDLAIGVAAQAVAGAGNGLENTATDTLLQQHTPEPQLGTVFGTVTAAAYLGQLLAYTVAAPLIDTLGPRATFLISGTGVLAALGYLAAHLPTTTT